MNQFFFYFSWESKFELPIRTLTNIYRWLFTSTTLLSLCFSFMISLIRYVAFITTWLTCVHHHWLWQLSWQNWSSSRRKTKLFYSFFLRFRRIISSQIHITCSNRPLLKFTHSFHPLWDLLFCFEFLNYSKLTQKTQMISFL